jgi:hypothetical protein
MTIWPSHKPGAKQSGASAPSISAWPHVECQYNQGQVKKGYAPYLFSI